MWGSCYSIFRFMWFGFLVNFYWKNNNKKYVIIYCLTETKEESPENSESLIISISAGVLLFAILVIGMSCLAKYGKLKNVLCCSVSWRGQERTLVRHVAEIFSRLVIQHKGDSTHDAGQEESHGMISPSKQWQWFIINYDRHMK